MARDEARRWKEPPGPPEKWTCADLLAGYKEVRGKNKRLEGTVARLGKRLKKAEGDKKDLVGTVTKLMDRAAGLEGDLKKAHRTNSALAAEMLEMHARGKGRSKRDGSASGKKKGGKGKGSEKGQGEKGQGEKGQGEKGQGEKGQAFTPLSNPHKGGAKPGEEGLPTLSEFLADPDQPIDEAYEIDQKVCPVDDSTPLSDPVESVEQTVVDMEVKRNKILTFKVRRWCPVCKKMHTAESPIALPNSRFSLRTDVILAALRVSGLPYGKARYLLASLLRIRIDENDLVRAFHRVAKHLGPLREEFVRQVRESGVVNVDETRWWIDGEMVWLWDFVTSWTIVLAIEASRGSEVPRKYLEGFEGTVCKDSYGATNGIGTAEQVCLQHYSREIDRTLRFKGPGAEFTDEMAPALIQTLEDARRADKYKSKRKRLECKKDLEARLDKLIQKEWTDPDAKRFAKRLRRERNKMFTFLAKDGVDWHNNDGERPFRPSVSIRKVTGGNRSWEGAEDHAVLHSVERTCNARGWDFCGSVAKHLAGNSTIRRVKPPESGDRSGGSGGSRSRRAKKGDAMRLAWPVRDGPSIGDLAAPEPKPAAAGKPPGKPPPPKQMHRKPGRGRAKRAKAAR